jgi:exosortase/archaeosortase family protein
MTRRADVLLRLAAVITIAAAGFLVLQRPARHVEAVASAGLFRLVGGDRVRMADADSIEVLPATHAPFRAVVTPSCSAIGSLVALACLASLVKGGRRRTLSMGAAMASIAAGNVIRISASLGMGLVAGRQSLILFHDWVGSMFGFAYTLGGFLLFLHLMLPARPSAEVALA